MRVNHTGEVCAQALYQGQALTARLDDGAGSHGTSHGSRKMTIWPGVSTRLKELDSRPSVLNPLFYAGAFTIGALAGKVGDRWSLGFVAETEHQVVEHLNYASATPAGL